ncbi:hypothetical protein IF2G_06818 [Cordyceps javanica]|nr:hypothetical protein IF2G_06818 [Cordyceps javanica]
MRMRKGVAPRFMDQMSSMIHYKGCIATDLIGQIRLNGLVAVAPFIEQDKAKKNHIEENLSRRVGAMISEDESCDGRVTCWKCA